MVWELSGTGDYSQGVDHKYDQPLGPESTKVGWERKELRQLRSASSDMGSDRSRRPLGPWAAQLLARLTEIRRGLDLGLSDLSSSSGVSLSVIEAIEEGRGDPTMSELERLAAALSFSPDALAPAHGEDVGGGN